MMKKYLLSLPTILLSLFIIYRVDSNAYIYALFILLSYSLILIFLERKEKRKFFFIYTSSVLLALFIAEIYFSFQYDEFFREHDLVYGDDLIRTDPIVGMVPMENSQYTSRAFKNDSMIYEVTVTIDEYGRRALPKVEATESQGLMFFGCSFTYGDGVEDNETLPYFFQTASNGNYQAYNYGFSGNGAHQTLAILENDLERKGVSKHKGYTAVYSLITDHVLRGTYSGFSTNSPKYRLDKQGKLFRDGLFSKSGHRFGHYLGKSNVVKALNPLLEDPKQKDIDLVASMLVRSAEIFEEKYQGKFYCILWRSVYEEREGLYEKVVKALNDKGIQFIEIDTILPDFNTNPLKYIIRNDGHPNALANKVIGEYLVELLSDQ